MWVHHAINPIVLKSKIVAEFKAITAFEDHLIEKSGLVKAIHRVAKPSIGAEDFSYFPREKPGAFILVRTRNEAKGIIQEIHHPEFNIAEDILMKTARTFAIFFLSGSEPNKKAE